MLARYYRPHLGLFIADMAAALLLAVCDMFYPMVTRSIINDYVPSGNMRLFLTWCAILLGIYVVKLGLNWFVMSWGHIMGARMQADMRRDLFHHMQSLPFSYFDENQTGSLMSRIVNDLMEITELAHHGPEDLFISIISFAGAFVMLGRINLLLTCIIFIFLPVLIFFNMRMMNRLQRAFRRRREETAAINADIQNSLSGIRVVKAFANTDYEEEKFGRRSGALVQAHTLAYRVMASYHSGMSFGIDVLTWTALLAAGIFVFQGKINIGDFAAYLLYIGNFTQPIRRLNQFVEQFQDGMSGFSRFAEVMATAPEQNPAAPESPKIIHGDIAFNDVSFTYGDKGLVLSHIDLHIPAGQTLALVGPSGGGKTTLCHLIPRFYSPQTGNITLDGVDVEDFDYTELRRSIGIVQQDVFIFSGTLRENIAYGNLAADEAAIVDAAQKAGLHEYVAALPDGYDTHIGERGAKLSGGQKQRISIARVFLKNPPILILDEATSALDNVTELAIQQAFDALAKNRTTLVVAHRLSTVRNADRIVVLTDSGIAEQGTHAQLMQDQNGVYRRLYETQFQGLETT
ncbi:ABC transporter ATP-binding protein/permease [Ruminococcaceae bacterium OttesenSCG-928-O06]|nr:ABC transporter ATP-binding protein/permease [Ruminococcaceae bacterium OttesenSCG-928-O06]